MNGTAILGSARAVGSLLDKLTAVASVVAIPVLIASTIVWYVDKPPQQNLWMANNIVVDSPSIGPGERQVPIGIPFTMTMATRRGRYWISLDSAGQVVYQYPTRRVADEDRFDFSSLSIDLPKSLKPGTYDVVVHIQYWFNPFKDGNTSVRVASMTVR